MKRSEAVEKLSSELKQIGLGSCIEKSWHNILASAMIAEMEKMGMLPPAQSGISVNKLVFQWEKEQHTNS